MNYVGSEGGRGEGGGGGKEEGEGKRRRRERGGGERKRGRGRGEVACVLGRSECLGVRLQLMRSLCT